MTAKLYILNPWEYDLWLMRIEQYFFMTDYSLLEVIKNGNKVLTKPVGSSEQTYEPTVAKEKQDRRNEMKSRGTLLMALPNKDQLKFHSYQDAKLLMEAIEKRLQKLISQLELQGEVIQQEDMNLKLLRSLPFEWKTHALIWRNKAELETISLDDLYNNLKIYEPELSGSSNTNQNPQNMAFVSSKSTSSTNEADTTASGVSTAHTQECRAPRHQDNRGREYGRTTVPVETPTENALIAQDGIGGNKSKAGLGYKELIPESFVTSSELLEKQNNRSTKGYHEVPPPLTGNYMPSKRDLRLFDEHFKSESVDVSTISSSADKTVKPVDITHKDVLSTEEPKSIMKNKFGPPIIEDWHSDDDSEYKLSPSVEVKTVKPSVEKIESIKTHRETVKTIESHKPHKHYPRGNRRNWNNLMSYRLGRNFKMINKACYVCGNFEHLQYVCDKNINQSAKINTAAASVNTAVRPVNVAGSQSTVNLSRRISKVIPRRNSQQTRPLNKFSSNKRSVFNKKVNTVRVNDSTARERAVIQVYNGLDPQKSLTLLFYVHSNPQQKEYKEKKVIDSGCFRHMTGNKCYLIDFEDFDGEFVFFRDGKGRIFDKGKIKIEKLDFDDVYFCIKREYSIAITPQQKKVAERRNRALIEAARTMLVDSKLPTTFWAKAVNTACYVLNRALVTKPHNKTPYELIHGRPPIIDFMKPFGCPVTILSTRDNLGKFEGKADEGYFVGYSVENVPNVKENGPDWLFDIDSLTIYMNYVPVVTRNQTNGIAGTKEKLVAGQDEKKKELEQEYSLIPICTTSLFISQDAKDSADDAGKKAPKVD
nr:ribonuclease H-like domain-containing protein [Tanacetum cinerariifolium]